MAAGVRVAIGAAALLAVAASAALIRVQGVDHVARAGFWFDGVGFDLPALDDHGGALDARERTAVVAQARAAVASAFDAWRLDVVETRRAHYRVRVVQTFGERRGPTAMAAAESRSFGPFGGEGAVSFEVVATLAVNQAPPGTPRDEIVAAIGRGIGRVAAHELAHQIVPQHPLHGSQDASSFDFSASNRREQFYGPLHWDLARRPLERALGVKAPRPASAR